LLAALMSSLASLFNSSATLFTVDFYKKYRPESSEKHLVKVGRIATAVVTILGVLWIPVMKNLGQVLYQYLQDVQSLLAPGIAAVFLLGVFWKRASAKAGMWGLIIGFVLGMTRLGLKIFQNSINPDGILYQTFLAPNWLHYCIYLFFICIVAIVIISLVTPRVSEARLVGLTYFSSTPEQRAISRASYDKWDIIISVIILVLIIGFYIYFWK
jgi:SSS family solute:Na+ symporter